MYLTEADGARIAAPRRGALPFGGAAVRRFSRFGIRSRWSTPWCGRSGSTLHWGIDETRRHRRRGPGRAAAGRRIRVRGAWFRAAGPELPGHGAGDVGDARVARYGDLSPVRVLNRRPERIVCMSPTINGRVSHWFAELPVPRDSLPGDSDADVCIVGAGYTGLWTAYYLKQADPSLRITVLEARFAGFGASGRNGGWLSGLAPGHRDAAGQAARPPTGDRLAARTQRRRRRGHRRGAPRGHRRRHRQGRHAGRRAQRTAGATPARTGRRGPVLGRRRHPDPVERRSGPTGQRRRPVAGGVHAALRARATGQAGARARRCGGAARRHRLRTDCRSPTSRPAGRSRRAGRYARPIVLRATEGFTTAAAGSASDGGCR